MEENKKEIIVRGRIAEVFIAITAIATIVVAFVLLFRENAGSFIEALGASAILCFAFGGMLPGITHIKGIFSKISKLLYIFPVGWAIFLVLILGIPLFGGWLFALYDLVKYSKLRKAGV